MMKESILPSEEFMDAVASSYGEPYDDQIKNTSHPSLSELANKYNTSTVRIRKILITRGLFSTTIIREVVRLRNEGKSIGDICILTRLKPAAVKASLPYEKGI